MDSNSFSVNDIFNKSLSDTMKKYRYYMQTRLDQSKVSSTKNYEELQ
jgi:hypothetical protein